MSFMLLNSDCIQRNITFVPSILILFFFFSTSKGTWPMTHEKNLFQWIITSVIVIILIFSIENTKYEQVPRNPAYIFKINLLYFSRIYLLSWRPWFGNHWHKWTLDGEICIKTKSMLSAPETSLLPPRSPAEILTVLGQYPWQCYHRL